MLMNEVILIDTSIECVSCNSPYFSLNPILLSLRSFGPLIIPPKHHHHTTYSPLYQAKQLV